MLGMAAAAVLVLVFVATIFILDRAGVFEDVPPYVGSPGHEFNHAAQAFVNITAVLGDESIVLSQVLLDQAATVFYFEGVLDLSRYIFTLEGENGRIYDRDIVFAQNIARQQSIGHTQLRFEPIDRFNSRMTLHITDLESGFAASIPMSYTADSITPGRFFHDSVEFADNPIEGLSVRLNHAEFSASGSSIGLSISHNFADGDIVFEYGDASPVSIMHRAVSPPPVNGILQTAVFSGGPTLARMDFSALQSLIGDVEIFLDGLYRLYEADYTVPVSEIFTTAAPRIYEIELSNDHRVTIRGMVRQGDLFVMPLFGERLRTHQIQDEQGIYIMQNTRIATTMAVNLVGTDALGRQQRIPGRVVFDERGTDVLFDINLNPNFTDIPAQQLWVEIDSISVRLPRISHVLNLSHGDTSLSRQRQDMLDAITGYFAHDLSLVESVVQVAAADRRGDNIYAIVMGLVSYIDGGILERNLFEQHLSGVMLPGGDLRVDNIATIRVE
jgi:hypothetical protein